MCTTTAAIAQALYLFQNAQEKPQQGLRRMDDPKWLLVCGDFSGIQKFIYNLTNKGAAKGLRRTFILMFSIFAGSVQTLFCMNWVCRGWRSFIIPVENSTCFCLPISKHSVLEVRTKVNSWLMDRFDDQVFFGIWNGIGDGSHV